jgi:broad specificity phosphatase PhoE
MLGFDNFIEEKKLLKEIEPKFDNFFNIKLPLCLWYLIFTILWFIGHSNDGESKKDSEIRAKKAALFLQKNAIKNGSILYVGHRGINRLIGNELKKLGWTFSQKFKTCYWGDNIFYLDIN